MVVERVHGHLSVIAERRSLGTTSMVSRELQIHSGDKVGLVHHLHLKQLGLRQLAAGLISSNPRLINGQSDLSARVFFASLAVPAVSPCDGVK